MSKIKRRSKETNIKANHKSHFIIKSSFVKSVHKSKALLVFSGFCDNFEFLVLTLVLKLHRTTKRQRSLFVASFSDLFRKYGASGLFLKLIHQDEAKIQWLFWCGLSEIRCTS